MNLIECYIASVSNCLDVWVGSSTLVVSDGESGRSKVFVRVLCRESVLKAERERERERKRRKARGKR